MAKRDSPSALHLGDDGVLRRMEVSIPTIARRDDHMRPARWEVRDAIPLSPQEIRRWIDTLGPNYSEHSRRHIEDVYAGVDGRDVHPDEMMNPHPSLVLRSDGSVMEARERALKRRNNEAYEVNTGLTKRAGCKNDWDCGEMYNCVFIDMQKEGTCEPDPNATDNLGSTKAYGKPGNTPIPGTMPIQGARPIQGTRVGTKQYV